MEGSSIMDETIEDDSVEGSSIMDEAIEEGLVTDYGLAEDNIMESGLVISEFDVTKEGVDMKDLNTLAFSLFDSIRSIYGQRHTTMFLSPQG